jgi:hypothetical protein
MSRGTIFTTIEIRRMRHDLNKAIIHPKMMRKARIRLSRRLFTINLLPSRKVMLVPVKVT